MADIRAIMMHAVDTTPLSLATLSSLPRRVQVSTPSELPPEVPGVELHRALTQHCATLHARGLDRLILDESITVGDRYLTFLWRTAAHELCGGTAAERLTALVVGISASRVHAFIESHAGDDRSLVRRAAIWYHLASGLFQALATPDNKLGTGQFLAASRPEFLPAQYESARRIKAQQSALERAGASPHAVAALEQFSLTAQQRLEFIAQIGCSRGVLQLVGNLGPSVEAESAIAPPLSQNLTIPPATDPVERLPEKTKAQRATALCRLVQRPASKPPEEKRAPILKQSYPTRPAPKPTPQRVPAAETPARVADPKGASQPTNSALLRAQGSEIIRQTALVLMQECKLSSEEVMMLTKGDVDLANGTLTKISIDGEKSIQLNEAARRAINALYREMLGNDYFRSPWLKRGLDDELLFLPDGTKKGAAFSIEDAEELLQDRR